MQSLQLNMDIIENRNNISITYDAKKYYNYFFFLKNKNVKLLNSLFNEIKKKIII